MKQIIYIDVYFILNFVLHLFLMMATAFFRKKCRNLKRIFFASFLMAGAAVLIPFLCAGRKEFESLLVLPELLLLLRLGFRFEGLHSYLKDFLVLLIMTCFLGGSITALLHLFRSVLKGNSVLWIFLASVLLFLSIFLFRTELLCHMEQQKNVYSVRLWLEKEMIEGKALYDTGNGLVSPYTGEGVTIVSRAVAECLPVKREKLQLIPYSSIGGKGLLEAFRIDALEILEKEEKRENVLIAVSDSIKESAEIQVILNSR